MEVGEKREDKNMSDTEYYGFSKKKTYKRISSVNIFLNFLILIF